jgi:hypothetical protein
MEGHPRRRVNQDKLTTGVGTCFRTFVALLKLNDACARAHIIL